MKNSEGRPMRARKDAVERLLAAYRRYYTITRFDGVREAPGKGSGRQRS